MNNVTKFSLVAIVLLAIIVSIPSFKLQAISSLSNWWPVDQVELTGVQPFKALVDGMSVEEYNMFWQVDDGQLNPMGSNYTDYPHKEASVDVSKWDWSSDGQYEVKFVAQRKDSNQTFAEREISIRVPGAQTSKALRETVVEADLSPLPIVTQAPVASVSASSVVKAQSKATLAPKASIWWPTDGAAISGTQPFKARLENVSLENYSMLWQVDGGVLNPMYDSYSEGAHKEAQVDVTNWSWKGRGPYTVTFVARDGKNSELARKSISIYNSNVTNASQVTSLQTSAVEPVQNISVVSNPVPAPVVNPIVNNVSTNNGNPLSGLSFYVNPNSNAKRQAEIWSSSRPTDAAQMAKIYTQPEARWLGDWNSNIYNDTKSYVDAAAARGEVPVMITYNIPGRDCGNYSAGGAGSNDAYKTWIRGLADGIGTRKAVVILEPDALTLTDCLSPTNREARFNLIKDAIAVLKSKGNIVVYVDAGHSGWVPVDEISSRLQSVGVSNADGFALNTSNFQRTSDLIAYGQNISGKLGGEHFVIDTARNGNGPNGSEWCNPSGRALGAKVTTNTGNSLVDAFLWLKNPGESDGSCNGAPSAGVWWPEYALGLAQRASY